MIGPTTVNTAAYLVYSRLDGDEDVDVHLVLDCCILLISAALDSARNSSRLSVLLDLCVSSTLIGMLRLLW